MKYYLDSRFFYDDDEWRQFCNWLFDHPTETIKINFPDKGKWMEHVEKDISNGLVRGGIRIYACYINPQDAMTFKLLWT